MASAEIASAATGAAPVRGWHRARIAEVVTETADARSYVLAVPAAVRERFDYRAGQFLTFRVTVDGAEHYRSYSMSSAPAVGDPLQVTVKRVRGGLVSNRLIDTLAVGDEVEVTVPAGVFVLRDGGGDLVAFAGGSGITPVFAVLKTVLATTSRRVRLLYANRDRASVIFARQLAELAEGSGGRLTITWHHDAESGLVDAGRIRGVLENATDAEYFVCGPEPFMDLVEAVLGERGADRARVHIERFGTPNGPEPIAPQEVTAAEVTVRYGRRRVSGAHRAGSTLLQTARALGVAPPSSCEAGSCATCIARIVRGSARMRHNDALGEDEVADGWVLTCQAFPTSPVVHVVYE
ncbi:ferredoxin--NADP reductase [Nocardia aurantia]|uniref:3-ketosteroid-9-alpha-monooxygenase, ferredoxin reductase component n=1 Tax=Nocardia aurantia TaxID=2585199 RepID=A0A7K0DWM3_9NOCA|nr:ferredoxin--NADP reductase [Nocardia aurantia]MQY29234.1 3-ketosteroid-9-alpha-monooxygenase, ferredoxin reductase component [Nocardia aurantia]